MKWDYSIGHVSSPEDVRKRRSRGNTRKLALARMSLRKRARDIIDESSPSGSWYTLPNGQKVQGRDAAIDAMFKLIGGK